MRFGWLPEIHTLETESLRIEPLDATNDAFASVRHSPRAHDDWFYPPLEPEWMSANDIGSIHISFTAWFALPVTHQLSFKRTFDDEEDASNCVIAFLGATKGLQLMPEGWGHLYRTPIKPGRHTDFLIRPAGTSRIVDRALHYWLDHPNARRWLFGALHWHLFGLSYDHPFERFGAAYSVLDTCWRIHVTVNQLNGVVPHASRIERLCEAYELQLPEWARVTNGASRLSDLRNEYFHESLWGGSPIGTGHPEDVPGIHLELFWFNTRLLFALVGERSSYTRSPLGYSPQLVE